MDFASISDLLSALFEIAAINILLSGDNAVVIALACRGLPPHQQRKAFLLGSALITRLMTRFPLLVTLGAALLGYVAGEMAVGDPSIKAWIAGHAPALDTIIPVAGALTVVTGGKLLARMQAPKPALIEQSAAE
jgi:predicted tellurium resistance membrane protein TerC